MTSTMNLWIVPLPHDWRAVGGADDHNHNPVRQLRFEVCLHHDWTRNQLPRKQVPAETWVDPAGSEESETIHLQVRCRSGIPQEVRLVVPQYDMAAQATSSGCMWVCL